MKLFLDENLSRRIVARLADVFPGISSVHHAELTGRPDTDIWNYAAEHGLVIVSKDDDFRQLSFLRGHPPKVIWLIAGNAGTDTVAELLLRSRDAIEVFVDQPEDALLTLNLE